jgi:hypothetical protein
VSSLAFNIQISDSNPVYQKPFQIYEFLLNIPNIIQCILYLTGDKGIPTASLDLGAMGKVALW